uniref:Uncharacterized protein n=1 Tax=Knipowitschia caucasica TaxID=637954 RepID=A0AAV2KAJ1_KNICA
MILPGYEANSSTASSGLTGLDQTEPSNLRLSPGPAPELVLCPASPVCASPAPVHPGYTASAHDEESKHYNVIDRDQNV